VALQDLVRSFGQRERISVFFNPQNLPGSIPKPIAGCLYRVTQESLRNAAKHGQASQVVVDLSGTSEGLDLSVKDNGKGFAAKQGKRPPHRGLGLISMQERLRLVNGIFAVQSRPGQGTEICAWVPLREE
jgi:signal transduction histidine kinase